jgi:hypothetical protein
VEQFLQNNSWIILLAALWTFPWKGIALWKAVKLGQKKWFVVLLVVNTLAILEIIYIFAIARKPAQGCSTSGGKEKEGCAEW